MEAWPFDDPENVAVFTTRQVMRDGRPILWVSHDAEDGAWQFHSGEAVEVADAMLVSLRSVFRLDPSIGELADLPLVWKAWRTAPGDPWRRQPSD